MGAKLKKLHTIFTNALTAGNAAINLSQNAFSSDLSAAKEFLTGVLSKTTLKIEKSGRKKILTTLPNTTSPTKITLTGKTQLFNLPKVEVTIEFIEPNGQLSIEATVKVLDSDPVDLPSLGGLMNQILDDEVLDEIPDQLLELPGITINSATMEFGAKNPNRPNKKTIKKLEFDVSSSSEWEVVPGFLSIKENQLDFFLGNLTNPATREIAGTALGKFSFADIDMAFSLKKSDDGEPGDENWIMFGSLDEGQTISLSDFAEEFLKEFRLPADLPDLELDNAEFTIDLKTKSVTFTSGSGEGLEIIPGFGINGLGIEIKRTPATTPSENAQNTAALGGTLAVAGVDLNLQALLQPNSDNQNKNLVFESAVEEGSSLSINTLVEGLSQFGDINLPAGLVDVSISGLTATYEKDTELAFGFITNLETDAKDIETDILLRMTKDETNIWAKAFEGALSIGDLAFEIEFNADPDSKSFFAKLAPGKSGEISLTDLMTHFINDLEGILPEVNILPDNAFFSFTKPKTGKGTVLFGVSAGGEMTFDNLPLVSPMLNGETIGVDGVLFTYTSSVFELKDVRELNLNLPKGKPKIPEVQLPSGINMSVSVAFGKIKQFIALPVAEQPAPVTPDAPLPKPTKPERAAEGKWFPVNKSMGPLNIARVGLNFQDSVLTFGLDASLKLGPLDLLLEELTFGSPLERFEPRVGLRGFGIGFDASPVEISGFFLRKPTDEYVGAALIKTPTFNLKAIGAFAMINGKPSFYLYAYLGYPIGGPAFFFIEGLAAGFGFNRSVKMPNINDVKSFPLVAVAVGEEPFLTVAERMATGNFVPIDPGNLFLAVGVRFTTFKQLDSFLLLIATFGRGFRLDMLGLSKLTVPAPVPGAKAKTPLAEIELALKGTFAPDEGFVGVQAQLTENSYILSKDCTLTGGFAFFTWFEGSEYDGEFVISVGGYHPKFNRPSHYPIVPRLGFNWELTEKINIKGGLYFALTPSILMAGGSLDATFKSGGLKAWFNIAADFIIGWKPYFYDARMSLEIGASYTFWFFGKRTISIDVGAKLHIWGPEFSGTADVDLGVIEVTIEFGAGTSTAVKPIRYSEFKKTFLPSENITTITVADGMLKEITSGGETIWIVNPKEFLLRTDSAVPSKKIEKMNPDGSAALAGVSNGKSDFGIGTVAVQNNQLETVQKIQILKGSDDFTDEFTYQPLKKSYPAALWGDKLVPDKNDKKRVIKNLLSGIEIKSKPPANPDQMGFLNQDLFGFQQLDIDNSFKILSNLVFNSTTENINTDVTEAIAGIHSNRNNILNALGFDLENDFEIDNETDFGFRFPKHRAESRLKRGPFRGAYASTNVPR